jgi:hypothetical protein
MKSNKIYVLLLAAAVAGFSSCTKEPLKNMTEEESRIYITNHDSTADFGSFKTFSIVDSVSVIDNNRLSSKEITQFDAKLINAVIQEMQSKGYVLVDRTANPDLGINVSRIYNTYTGVVDYPDYWGGYGSYYDPYYWGYGGSSYYFPDYYGLYQVTEGSVSIDVLDLKDAATTKKIEGIWTGLIRGSGVFNNATTADQVKQLFNQSPYLKSNQ